MLCVSNCVKPLPINPIGAECDIEFREGGILHLIAAQCDVIFDDENPITDWEVWKTLADSRRVMISPPLRSGEKPETEDTTERITVCLPEDTINETHLINGQSVWADAANLTDYDFWNDLKTNLKFYNIGWVGCDGLVYTNGLIPGFKMSGKINEIIPENNDNLKYIMFALRFKYKGLIKPLKIDNFLEAFETAPVS